MKFLVRIFSNIALVALFACGGDSGVESSPLAEPGLFCVRPLISGGTECHSTATPVVRLDVVSLDGASHCTGAIISETEILTAAHCVVGAIGAPIVTFADGSSVVSLKTKIVGRYLDDPIPAFDVSLITVASEEIRNRGMAPLVIDSTVSAPPSGTEFSVIGFGVNLEGQIPELPRRALMVVTTSLGEGSFHATPVEGKLGAGTTCPGDSGAPAIIERQNDTPRLVGIVTEGLNSRECSAESGSIFADLKAPEVVATIGIRSMVSPDR